MIVHTQSNILAKRICLQFKHDRPGLKLTIPVMTQDLGQVAESFAK